MREGGMLPNSEAPRHAAIVRVTHWLTALCFFALLVSGLELVVSHPRFYWGETGNVNTRPLFKIPIPASRASVPTGYSYGLPDQNGWSRYLHFEAAWALVISGLVYFIWGVWSGHFRHNLFPASADRSWQALLREMGNHIRMRPPSADEAYSYNVLQRAAYLVVIFVVFPLIIWTGLVLSPGFNSAVPAAVNLLGGRQSARTLHFFLTGFLVAFLAVHVGMVIWAGFASRVRAMITGVAAAPEERG